MSKVRVSNASYYKMILTKVLSGVLIVVGLLIVLYISLAVTIMRVIPSSNLGLVPVKNVGFSGGLIPEGAIIVIGEEQRPSGILGNAMNAVIPQTNAIVQVEAGPNGKINWSEGGVTTVDGSMLDVKLEENPGEYLKGRYIVKCLVGCSNDFGRTIDDDQVVGIPLIDKFRVKVGDHVSIESNQSGS